MNEVQGINAVRIQKVPFMSCNIYTIVGHQAHWSGYNPGTLRLLNRVHGAPIRACRLRGRSAQDQNRYLQQILLNVTEVRQSNRPPVTAHTSPGKRCSTDEGLGGRDASLSVRNWGCEINPSPAIIPRSMYLDP